MKAYFRNTSLIMSDSPVYNHRIGADVPQRAFIKSHKADIEKEMGA